MTDTPEALISRYLDQTADADDVRRLDELVRADADVRRELFLASAHDAHLRECLAEDQDIAPVQPTRWRPGIVWAVSAAAAMLLVAVGLALFIDRYPDPEVSGAYRIVGGGPVERGSVIVAERGLVKVSLGGYCRVDLDEGGRLQIAGAKRAEEVVLRQGRATCQADRDVGTFAVRTDVGSVSVTGTQFSVKTIEDQGDHDMFNKRMAVSVLTGAVLISGAWGEMTLQAGETAITPPPEAVLRKIVADLNLPAVEHQKVMQILSSERVKAFRSKYRTTLRSELFEVAHKTLSSTMPKIMPKKVSTKIRAIRMKLRAGPPKPGDIARIRLAMQQRTRVIMMTVIHKTADELADKGAADDHLIASMLAKKVRAKLPAEKIVAFEAAVKAAKIPDSEPEYFAQAAQRVQDAIKAYDPDITGIIDTKTGRVIVSDEQLGAQLKNPASDKRIAGKLNGILAGLNLSKPAQAKIAALLSGDRIEAQRAAAYTAIRARLFAVARERLQTAMPKKMPAKVQKKVMAIRMRLKAGGPPSADELSRIQSAVMDRSRSMMMRLLHQTADTIAAGAIEDDNPTAIALAGAIRAKLSPEQTKAFNAALTKAAITGDESKYAAQTEKKIDAIIEAYDPDLSGIVDSKTGKVIAGNDK
ncbi:MAG: FecR domain-containing protein [Phycisphaerae bacterium]|nr:FecR domain-containing protein [Phycisphaerae bacterium]